MYVKANVETEGGPPFRLQLGAHTAPGRLSTLDTLDWPVSTFPRHEISDRPGMPYRGVAGGPKGENVETEGGPPLLDDDLTTTSKSIEAS